MKRKDKGGGGGGGGGRVKCCKGEDAPFLSSRTHQGNLEAG